MQCPHCGATNPDSAQWCGQCYRRFDDAAAPPPGPDPATVADAHEVVALDVPAAPPLDRAPPTLEDSAGTIRREGDRIEWACPQCDHFNPIELPSCEVCGSAFIDRFRTAEPEKPRNWNAALLLSALAPGAGHIAVERYGTGIARLVLFAGWILGALVLGQSGGNRAILVVAPLLLGAVALWVGSVVDIYRLQQGDQELLGGRPLLWLVVGVLVLMGLGLFGSLSGQVS